MGAFMDIYEANHMGEKDSHGRPQVPLCIICANGWLRGIKWWAPQGRIMSPAECAARARSFKPPYNPDFVPLSYKGKEY